MSARHGTWTTWALLAASSADVQVDPEVFARQHLERLAFLDNTETDTQVSRSLSLSFSLSRARSLENLERLAFLDDCETGATKAPRQV